ncbi:Delta-like protein C [Holothuria leucospilota]|uniref:Delta-like protein C n=1 Tax=Holothuria leucospilota TaxID=206669 RepID=A0A9Q1CJZ0_HOLLE|nr:Delta-like protein C [Holothuria leucospilota]
MCENAGICVQDGSSQKCFCPDGFIGKKCQIPVEAKAHHLAAVIARCSCRNGGTCTPTSTGFGFVCSCPPGFSGFDCALNNTSIPATSAEYGIAMGAAVVAVLLVMFGIALCMCVILQYIRQQREGPEGNYRPALSRDVYSVEGVNISGILRIESLEANNYVPPSYSQCVHSTPNSPIDSEVFLSPAHSNQSVRAWHHIQRAQRTPDSPPPTYDAIIGICKQCSQLRKGGYKFRNMKSLGSEPALIRYSRGQQIVYSEHRPTSLPTTPQDVMELREVR